MAIYKSEEQYLAENPDVAAAVEAGDFATGAQHYLAFGEREILEGVRSPTAEYTPPATGITQEELAAEIAKIPAPVVQGGGSNTTNITGPTQEEMITAFKKAQDTSGIMSAIGTGTGGVDTPATGLSTNRRVTGSSRTTGY